MKQETAEEKLRRHLKEESEQMIYEDFCEENEMVYDTFSGRWSIEFAKYWVKHHASQVEKEEVETGWVSVEDGFPENTPSGVCRAMVYTVGNEVFEAHFEDGKFSDMTGDITDQVTYWGYKPEPPNR